MEDEQKPKKNTGKGTQAKASNKNIQDTHQYIIEATQIPNNNINKHQSTLSKALQCKDCSRRNLLL